MWARNLHWWLLGYLGCVFWLSGCFDMGFWTAFVIVAAVGGLSVLAYLGVLIFELTKDV